MTTSSRGLSYERPDAHLEVNRAIRGRPGSRPRTHRWWPALVCLSLYVVVTLLVFGLVTSLGATTMAGGRRPDQIAQVWWLAWDQFALAHGHNLFFTNWQNYPVGYNFGVNGSLIALGVVFSPITTLFGPIVTWNVLVRLAMIASAFSMCLVLRRWTRWWPAAFVGGAVYGFSAYMLDSGSGYLFLTFVPIPPLMFLLLHEILVRQGWRATRTGALLGALCGVQYLIFPEVLASTVLLGAMACVLYVAFNRRAVVARIAYIRRAGVSAILVGSVALGVPLLFTFFGPQPSKGEVITPAAVAFYHGDLLGPIASSGNQRFPLLTFPRSLPRSLRRSCTSGSPSSPPSH